MNNITKQANTEKKSPTKMPPEKAVAKKSSVTNSRKAAANSASPSLDSNRPSSTYMVNAEERQRMIAFAAYIRAEQRGFMGGDPVADWLAAETEIDSMLSQSSH